MPLHRLAPYVKRIGIFGVIAFILILFLEVIPLLPNSVLDNFKNIGQQRSLGLRMVNSAYILASHPNQAEAVDIIQKSLPVWEQEQQTLIGANLPADIKLFISQSQPDFASLDQALHAIIRAPGSVSHIELQILADHEDSYFVFMSQALNADQQEIYSNSSLFFCIELILEISLLLMWIRILLAVLSSLKKSEMKHEPVQSPDPSSSTTKYERPLDRGEEN